MYGGHTHDAFVNFLKPNGQIVEGMLCYHFYNEQDANRFRGEEENRQYNANRTRRIGGKDDMFHSVTVKAR